MPDPTVSPEPPAQPAAKSEPFTNPDGERGLVLHPACHPSAPAAVVLLAGGRMYVLCRQDGKTIAEIAFVGNRDEELKAAGAAIARGFVDEPLERGIRRDSESVRDAYELGAREFFKHLSRKFDETPSDIAVDFPAVFDAFLRDHGYKP